MNIKVGQVWRNRMYGREFEVIKVLDEWGGRVRLESVGEPKTRMKMLDVTLEEQFELVQDV